MQLKSGQQKFDNKIPGEFNLWYLNNEDIIDNVLESVEGSGPQASIYTISNFLGVYLKNS